MNELVTSAQRLLEEIRYLTLATADGNGRPWSSTVWYAAWRRSRSPEALAVDLVWLSRPEAQHSRNLVERPEVGLSIFDSHQPAGTGIGLQLAARAEPVPTDELDEALRAFSQASVAAGGGPWTREKLEEPAVLRPYVARIETALLLGDGTRVEIPLA